MMDEETTKLLEEGYREMVTEHLVWAEMVFPIAKEMGTRWVVEDGEEVKDASS